RSYGDWSSDVCSSDLIEVIDPNDPDQGYSIEDAEAGVIYRPCGWGQTMALMAWGWQAYSSQYILPGGTNALRYTVTYTAGYFLRSEERRVGKVCRVRT